MTCNCPESGTSGSCPFHDASTRFTVEPQPGRWDTRLGRIVTELEDAAYERGRAEATAAAEQRLRERITAELQPGNEHGLTYQAGRNAGLRKALALLDAPPPASPRQGEPVALDEKALEAAIGDTLDLFSAAITNGDGQINWWVFATELAPRYAAALSEPAEP